MKKNKFYKDLTEDEKNKAEISLRSEMTGLDFKHPIRLLMMMSWFDYIDNKFTYDGPTFSKSRFSYTNFEMAAFIHDWRNSNGFVGKNVDNEMFDIMITLNYPLNLLKQRWKLTRFTFLNVLRHKIKRTYVKINPKNLFKL